MARGVWEAEGRTEMREVGAGVEEWNSSGEDLETEVRGRGGERRNLGGGGNGRSLEESVLEWRSVFLVRDLEGGPGDRVSKGVVRSS